MGRSGVVGYALGVVTTVTVALLFVAILNAILTSPAAIQPGEPLYRTQQSIVGTFGDLLPLLVPGAVGAAYVIFNLLSEW